MTSINENAFANTYIVCHCVQPELSFTNECNDSEFMQTKCYFKCMTFLFFSKKNVRRVLSIFIDRLLMTVMVLFLFGKMCLYESVCVCIRSSARNGVRVCSLNIT